MTSVAQIKSNEEPPSGIQGKGTIDEPYDQGNAPENTTASNAPTAGTSSQPINSTVEKSDSSPTAASKETTPTTAEKGESRGRDALKAPARARQEERSVSPGTMPDGSHAKTSGDRGESYEPGRLSKLKGKFSIGKH